MSLFERRAAPRAASQSQALVVRGLTALALDIEDFSQGGCRALRPRGWNLDIDDKVTLYVFNGAGPAMRIEARIAWYREDHVGMEFLGR